MARKVLPTRGEQIHQGAARIVRTGEEEMKKEMLRKMMSSSGAAQSNFLPMAKRGTTNKLDRMLTEIQRGITKRAMKSYKRGGKVKKTGPALLHKGEMVVPKGMHMMDGKLMSDKEMQEMMYGKKRK